MEERDFSGLMNGTDLPSIGTVEIPAENLEFLGQYLESTASSLEALEAAAMAYESEEEGEESVASSIRQILHSMKGEAGIVGLSQINEMCHEAESAFEALEEEEERADMLLRTKDWIAKALDCLANGPSGTTSPAPATPEQTTSPQIRCLIVEDEFTSRKLLQAFLAPHANCDIAVDGAEAVEAFRHALESGSPYDLICLDIMMPQMNGQEALKEIRKIEQERGVGGLDVAKVVMTSALNSSNDVLGAFRGGCEAYVVKPVHKDKLYEELRKLGLIQ